MLPLRIHAADRAALAAAQASKGKRSTADLLRLLAAALEDVDEDAAAPQPAAGFGPGPLQSEGGGAAAALVSSTRHCL